MSTASTLIQRHCSALRGHAPALLGLCPTAQPPAWPLDQHGPALVNKHVHHTHRSTRHPGLDAVLKDETSSCLTLRCLARALSGYKTGSPPKWYCAAHASSWRSPTVGLGRGPAAGLKTLLSATWQHPACVLRSHNPGGEENNTTAEMCTNNQGVLL